MPFLLLQTFAWMVLAGLLGAMLGCLARRIFAPQVVEAAAVAAGTTARVSVPAAPARPLVEASKAPRPVAPAAPAPAAPPRTAPSRAGEAYTYPITTVGIPRANPELIQPQIQQITLPSAPAAAAGAVATVVIRQVAGAAASGAAWAYPITTVGIPSGFVPVEATPTDAALAAVKGYAARFERPPAVAEAPQPRPEPLRPELGRSPSPVAGAPAPAPAQASAQSPTPEPAATAPAEPSKTIDEPYAPVAAGGPALAALAARAAAEKAAPATATAAVPAVPAVPDVAEQPAANAPVAAAPSAAGDDLMRIRAIDAVMSARLKSAGIMKFADIARWSKDDVARISQVLGLTGRVEQENWIEQAQILTTGAETDYSRRRLRGEIPTVPASPMVGGAAAAAAAMAAVTRAVTAVEPAVIAPSAPALSPDQTGSAAASAAAAAMASVARAAIANVEPVMPAKLADAIRENAAAKPDAEGVAAASDVGRVARPDLVGLRSVRSEALRDVSASGTVRPMGVIEDLKRIRGIGVLIEKKLNSLGVTGYEQIANWTNADIDRVSQILDFKGRIERESWVEQARILASGGNTEFSKRVDRGEA